MKYCHGLVKAEKKITKHLQSRVAKNTHRVDQSNRDINQWIASGIERQQRAHGKGGYSSIKIKEKK